MLWVLAFIGFPWSDRVHEMNPKQGDPTPYVGSETDIAPLGTGVGKPLHEQTADEDRDIVEWDRVAEMPEFRDLLRKKVRWILPASIFFIVYYFALPVLVGYAPDLMSQKVLGSVNVAYLFALSQFFMAWAVAALYVRAAGRFDRQSAEILKKIGVAKP